MPEETVVDAASSAAVEAPVKEVSFDIPRSNTPEYAEWRKTGELSGTKQETTQETSSTSNAEEGQQSEKAGEPDAPQKKQEQKTRRPDAEQRIKQLTDEVAQVKRDLEEARKPKEKTQAESSTAKAEERAQPQNYQEWRKGFKPAEWVQQYGEKNPEATYEDAQAAMADHLVDVRDQFRGFEQQQQERKKEMDARIADAKAKYGDDAMDVISPTVDAILGDKAIPHSIKEMLDESEVAPHLFYVLGSDAAEMEKFRAMARDTPAKAKRYLAALEVGINAEISGDGQAAAVRDGKTGQFTAKAVTKPAAPAKRGSESAAEPPLEVGARGSGTMDESQRALQAIERGDANATRAFFAAENAKAVARRRG